MYDTAIVLRRVNTLANDLFALRFDLQVDFLDTAGDFQFPAMRRLSIANAQAFMIVYAIDDPVSFTIAQNCFEEIREVRQDFQVSWRLQYYLRTDLCLLRTALPVVHA